jgi:hypothetical protein
MSLRYILDKLLRCEMDGTDRFCPMHGLVIIAVEPVGLLSET